MPATLGPPSQGRTYTGGLSVFTVAGGWRDKPAEGDRCIPVSINWATDADALGVCAINLANITTQEFGAVRAIYVDNTHSGVDALFIFADVQHQITVAAGTEGVFPVISNSRTVYAVGIGALSTDNTFVQFLNCMIPPVAYIKSVFMSAASVLAVSLTVSADTQIIPLGVNGTITGLTVEAYGFVSGAGGAQSSVTLRDGSATPVVLNQSVMTQPVSTTEAAPVIIGSMTGVNIRFNNGVVAHVVASPAPTGGSAAINIYYRMP